MLSTGQFFSLILRFGGKNFAVGTGGFGGFFIDVTLDTILALSSTSSMFTTATRLMPTRRATRLTRDSSSSTPTVRSSSTRGTYTSLATRPKVDRATTSRGSMAVR